MRNVLKYTDFKQTQDELITESIGGEDKYFENVKGNLAGAENTLVGSAVIKLFGFVKRKGMQAYMKAVLKPKLGKQYFNSILRYVVRNTETIRPPIEKSLFEIKRIEDKKAIGDTMRVTMKNGDDVGLYAYVNGASISNQDGSLIEDGKYSFIYYIGSTFTVESGAITDLSYGYSSSIQESDEIEKESQTQSQPQSQEEVKTEFDEFKEENEQIADGTDADPDIIASCKEVRDNVSNNKKITSDELEKLIHDTETQIHDLQRLGIHEIDELLDNDSITELEREEYELDKKSYSANIAEFTKLFIFLSSKMPTNKPQVEKPIQTQKPVQAQPIGESLSAYGNFLFEETNDVVTFKNKAKNVSNKVNITSSKKGDELQELYGKVVDFNDPEFYKQFEDAKVKTAVSNLILENKPDIVKIQLQAERIIGTSKKLKNNWERMVQDVLSKYSKFVLVDKVNPITLGSSTPTIDDKDKDKEGKKKKDDGINDVELFEFDVALENIKPFKDISKKIGKISEMKNNQIGMFYGKINSVNRLWVYQLHELTINEKKKARVAYRILGYISDENRKKMKSNPEAITDIKQYVSPDFYNLFINKESKTEKSDGNKRPLKGVYLIMKSSTIAYKVDNLCTIGLLYYGDGFDIGNESTYSISLKGKDRDSNPLSISKDFMDGVGKKYLSTIYVKDSVGAWLIEKPEVIIDTKTQNFNYLTKAYNDRLNKVVPIESKKIN